MRRHTASVLVAFVLAGAGCGPAGPPPVAPSPVWQDGVITGVVHEHTPDGERPLPGITVRLTTANAAVPVGPLEATTGAMGQYEFRRLPAAQFSIASVGASHVQPCGPVIRSENWRSSASIKIDLHVVPEGAVADGRVMPTSPYSGASGAVFELLAGAKVPVAGAKVDLWTEDQIIDAVESDDDGRFGLCATYQAPLWVAVSKSGYIRTAFLAVPAVTRRIDVELIRQQ